MVNHRAKLPQSFSHSLLVESSRNTTYRLMVETRSNLQRKLQLLCAHNRIEDASTKANGPQKIEWHGVIVSVQPRTTVWRYRLDNRTHYHRGYNLFLDGEANGTMARFSVAISEKQQQKLVFIIGDEANGTVWTKMYDVSEYADYYRTGGLKIIKKAEPVETTPPPYLIALPDMATYERRGARMLSTANYKGKCFQCAWATMSAVEIEYNWGVSKKYRFESFCYGPKSCRLYKMGKPRAVP